MAIFGQGCSSYSLDEPLDRETLDLALADRGVDPGRVVMPYALREDMAKWARETVEGEVLGLEKLQALSDRLLDPDELPIDYVWGYTGTAKEVFDQREANCLAFTNLFVGMARAVDVPVYFMAVDNVESFRKEGDLVIVSDHVAVGFGGPGERKVFDFSEERDGDLRFVRRLSDLTAIAMFHSNRGAEALQRGRIDEALLWLRVAVQIDDRLMNAWVNLGVAERRIGRYVEAEAAYKRALVLDPRGVSAFQNLASLLRYQGRMEEAEAYEEILGSAQSQNPFTYLSLGDLSLQGGRFDEARRFYRRAVNLSSGAEAYAALGQAAAAAGDLRQARRHLRKALRADETNPRAAALRQLLQRPSGAGEDAATPN
ncbi:MAG: tetratricopeptide repeat protein [Acidobacteriota bacterium]